MDVPKKLVRSLVRHFAAASGWQGDSFYLTFDKDEYLRIAKRRGYVGITKDEDFGGTITGPMPVIWVNLPRHRSWRQLVDTCAHEALHAAQPDLRHGAEYEAAVKRLLMEREP